MKAKRLFTVLAIFNMQYNDQNFNGLHIQSYKGLHSSWMKAKGREVTC